MSACPRCHATTEPNVRYCGSCGASLSASLPPEQAEWIVGSDESADVRIDHPSISRRHLAVRRAADGHRLIVRDLGSSNGTSHRGLPITQVEVSPGESIQLGLVPVIASKLVPPARPQAAPAPAPRPLPDAATSPTLVVGRDDDAPLRIDLPVVSGRHAEVRLRGGALEIRDLGSTNGTFVFGRKVSEWTPVPLDATVQLGSYRLRPDQLEAWRRALAPASGRTDAGLAKVPLAGTLTIGRDPASDLVLDHATVSWHHARLDVRDGVVTLTDLRSTNGVFVDGQRVSAATVSPASVVRLGSVPLKLESGGVLAPKHYKGEIRLDALGVTRRLDASHGGRVILDDVSVTIYPGEMVALMGPSGAGKTTLLEVLTGQRRPSSGTVLVNGADLHAGGVERIGYVPQEDVMHRDLTVYEVLYYAARLRLPGDLPDASVREHVERLLARMGLAHIRDTLIGGEHVRGVSGGQRKRVNIAIELITEPPLLFLDEPTSGLDATSTLEVLSVLRSLADEGKTIVMTIHQPRVEAFRLVDMVLLLAKGGKLAYFGPSVPGVVEYFSKRSKAPFRSDSNPADFALDVLDPRDAAHQRAPEEWQADYRSSETHHAYVAARRGEQATVELSNPGGSGQPPSALAQSWTMVRRLCQRKARDRAALTLQVLQPLVVGAVLMATFHGLEWPVVANSDLTLSDPLFASQAAGLQASNKAHAIVFLIAATTFWLGCSNVARELVAERAVFRRERMAGLSVGAYLCANFLVQALAGCAQVGILFALGWAPELHASFPEAAGLGVLTLASGIGVGMWVSSLARTEVTAISSLPLLLLPQLLLAGYIQSYKDLGDGLRLLSSAMPVRWGFESMLDLEYRSARPLFSDVEDVIGFANAELPYAPLVLVGFIVVTLLGTYLRLLSTSNSADG